MFIQPHSAASKTQTKIQVKSCNQQLETRSMCSEQGPEIGTTQRKRQLDFIMNSNQSNWIKWKWTLYQITKLSWIPCLKPHISLEINQTRAKLRKFIKNQTNFQIKKEERKQNEETKARARSTLVNSPNSFDCSWSYSYPQLPVPFRALKFIKIN